MGGMRSVEVLGLARESKRNIWSRHNSCVHKTADHFSVSSFLCRGKDNSRNMRGVEAEVNRSLYRHGGNTSFSEVETIDYLFNICLLPKGNCMGRKILSNIDI